MEYVNVFARPVNQQSLDAVLLCYRLKDDWQKGMFNLVGGKRHDDESVIDAALRELREESGFAPAIPGCEKVMGRIESSSGVVVHCVKITVPFDDPKPEPGEEDAQYVAWADWREMANSPLLIPNLRVILPLMSQGVTDWVIQDEGPTWECETHDFKMTVRSDNKRMNG